jgi:hypothetical protein
MAAIEGSNTVDLIDTIEFGGKYWLVPKWIVFSDEKVQKPARIIALETIPHQSLQRTDYPAAFVVNGPLPRFLIEGEVPPEAEKLYVVIMAPDIVVPFSARLPRTESDLH